jgi:hypothetical protein
MSVSAAQSDLQPGMQVMVTGQTGDDGSITASQVQVLNSSPRNLAVPPPAGTEP